MAAHGEAFDVNGQQHRTALQGTGKENVRTQSKRPYRSCDKSSIFGGRDRPTGPRFEACTTGRR